MAKPLQSTTVADPSQHERGPKDLLRPTPPPDPKTGRTPAETMQDLEDAARAEKQPVRPAEGVPGAFNHPRRSGADRCGARYGQCWGEIVGGKCSVCGADYTRRTPLGGTNDPRM